MRCSFLGLVLLAACGGASAPRTTTSRVAPEPAGAPPFLLDKPVWDGALTDPMALKALDRVRIALADKPPTLSGGDPQLWTAPVQAWVEKRVRLTSEVRLDANAIASDPDPRMQLLATIVFAVAADDFVSDLLAIEPPAEYATGEFAAETKAAFREALESQSASLVAGARLGMQKCVTSAPAAPAPLRVWETYCHERDASLGDLQARVAARAVKPPSKPPAMFADCDTSEVGHVDPDAPPPDPKAKPAVAYIYAGNDLKGDDVQKLEQAVSAKLGPHVGMPVVAGKELAAARELVGQKKLHPKAAVCGQAPPLPAVIAHKHRNLIVGEIETTCLSTKDTQRCGLLVQYTRAGSDDTAQLPGPMFGTVTARSVPAAEWISAADRLVPDAGAFASIIGSTGETPAIFFKLASYRDEDPWLRVASTLHSDTSTRIAACVDAPASFDVKLTISKVGKTQQPTLTPLTAPPAGSKVAECVRQALEATGWPCPLDGKPAKLAVRMCVAPRPK